MRHYNGKYIEELPPLKNNIILWVTIKLFWVSLCVHVFGGYEYFSNGAIDKLFVNDTSQQKETKRQLDFLKFLTKI